MYVFIAPLTHADPFYVSDVHVDTFPYYYSVQHLPQSSWERAPGMKLNWPSIINHNGTRKPTIGRLQIVFVIGVNQILEVCRVKGQSNREGTYMHDMRLDF